MVDEYLHSDGLYHGQMTKPLDDMKFNHKQCKDEPYHNNQHYYKQGYGVLLQPNGSIYQGYFVNDYAEGKGKLTNPEGDFYEGEFQYGLANGYGVYTHKNGSRYEGQWKDDK